MAGSGALWKAAKTAAKAAKAAGTAEARATALKAATWMPAMAFAGWPAGSEGREAMGGMPTMALGTLGG